MAGVSRPLWQLLLIADTPDEAPLSCAECFTILKFLADLVAAGGDPAALEALARRHLRRCPPCRADWAARLGEIELELFPACRLPRAPGTV